MMPGSSVGLLPVHPGVYPGVPGPHSRLIADQLAYSCFSQLMKRMSQNFPNGGAMDTHFANMRSLIQVSAAAA